jgi:hypothetical protein
MNEATITIARRFHGPKNSGNGGYVCGRLAAFVEGTARVRLYVPPPLDTPLRVVRTGESVSLDHQGQKIAEAWPADLNLEVPEPPDLETARDASRGFRGFQTHRFPTCFVCGRDRGPDDGLQIFAGPVSPEFVWCVLDCPGGFAFPEPETGTILLGELTVARYEAPLAGQTYIVTAWEISAEGRKHDTGTALFSADGRCLAAGRGTWFEVEPGLVE